MSPSPGNRGPALDRIVAELTHAASELGFSEVQSPKAVWRTIAGRLLGTVVHTERLNEWFGSEALPIPVVELGELRPSVEDVISAFERTAPLRLAGTAKRDSGMYYTPPELADLVVAETIRVLSDKGRPVAEWRIIDPAAGAGMFGIALLRGTTSLLFASGMRADEASEYALTRSIYLVDADPLAIAMARSLLVVEFGTSRTNFDAVEQHVVCGDAVVGGPDPTCQLLDADGFDWARQFPEVFGWGGFDAVIGNPPWGAIKPSAREYAATLDPSLLRLDGLSMRASLLESSDSHRRQANQARSYAARLRSSGYEHQGAGDTEFYRYFLEMSHGLVRPEGVIGVLVPSAFQRASGAAPLRRLFMDDGTIELWLDFLNSRGIFAIHKMFRFALLVWRAGGSGGIRRACFGVTSVQEAVGAANSSVVTFSNAYLTSVSKVLRTIPDVRSADDAELYRRLHASHPALGEQVSGGWSIRFRRELDMTNDAHHFVPTDRALRDGASPDQDGSWNHPNLGKLLPVFEGRMVHQFDAAAKGHVQGHGRSARWELLGPSEKGIRPQYLVPAVEAERRQINRAARASFCDVTGHANERTVLAAVVPGVAVCGNKVPTCDFENADEDVTYLWTALANSLVTDWLARRRVSTTLNYFHWNELPFPRLDPSSGAGRRLVTAARALTADPGRPWTMSLAERAELRVAIDVEVMQLFGLDPRDASVILRDFPLLDRGAPPGHHTVTRDLVLAGLSTAVGLECLRLSDLGLDASNGSDRLLDRIHWHASAGAIAYIPGEFALSSQRIA